MGNREWGNNEGGIGKGKEVWELIYSLTLSLSLSRPCCCPIPYSPFPIP